MGLNHHDLTLALFSFVYSLSVYWALTTLSKLSWAFGILVNKTGKRKILSIHWSIYRKSQSNLYYTHVSKPSQSFQRQTSQYGPCPPWDQHCAFSNEEMLLSCTISKGCQIGMKLISASCGGGLSGALFWERFWNNILTGQERVLDTRKKNIPTKRIFIWKPLRVQPSYSLRK